MLRSHRLAALLRTAIRGAAAVLIVAAGVSLLPTSSRGETIDDRAPLAEVAAYVQARAAFARNCFRCHKSDGEEASKKSLERLDMSRYPFGGRRSAVAGRIVKRVLGATGVPATMPKDDPESVSEADVVVILRWADVFEASRVVKDKEPARTPAAKPSNAPILP